MISRPQFLFMKILMVIFVIVPFTSQSQNQLKTIVLSSDHEHRKWTPECKSGDYLKDFRAYSSCFDGPDDDNGDGIPDTLRVPHWVAYQINRIDNDCIETHARPNPWITDRALYNNRIMCGDESYKYPQAFRDVRKDWFERGHLCMKMHAERLGADAGWNSHTFYNAVPQRGGFNKKLWLDLEYLTDQWAQRFGKVWVITGPVFSDGIPYAFIGEPGEMQVAIPDALFKIVIKENDSDELDVLAFIYPQFSAGYAIKQPNGYNHLSYLTTVEEIEKVTGLKFFPNITETRKRNKIVKFQASELWPSYRGDMVPPCRN